MAVDFVGKILFPRLQPWQRRREVKTLALVFVIAIALAAIIAAVILMTNSHPR